MAPSAGADPANAVAKPAGTRLNTVWFLWASLALLLVFVLYNAGWEQVLSYLLLGLPQGCIIAMIALGYSMVYGIIQLINFAHGEIFMLSAYLTLALVVPADWANERWVLGIAAFAALLAFTVGTTVFTVAEEAIRSGWHRLALAVAAGAAAGLGLHQLFRLEVPYFLAVAISAVVAPSLGIAMDRIAYRPLRSAPRLIPLITAIGVSIFLVNFSQLMFSATDFRIPDDSLPPILQPYFPSWDDPEPQGLWETITVTKSIPVTETVSIQFVDVIILGLTLVMLGGVNFFVQKTKAGAAMRACALDQNMARLVGIDVNRTVAMTFALGSALAAVASPFYVVKYASISPTMGYIVGILAFSSAVLGGIGSIKGAMLGGFLLGIIYNLVPLFEVTADWPFFEWLATLPAFAGVENWNLLAGISEWRLGLAYIFMMVVLVVRPSGLFGQSAAARRA
ncbi:MAG: branched-chain amino acid ABC transporter permease [Candidatus Sumerlaeia bacterium]|nr:branched-chain amino acid ABC transporter permease [Candidatus Sumerlaeia bacterium]